MKRCVPFTVLLITLVLPAPAQEQCREFGLASGGGPYGYTWRSSRCEGVFKQPVSGSMELRLVSFSAGLDPTVIFSTTPALKLTWQLPAASDVRLRATSLRSRHYYRMDARRTSGQGATYDWPTEVLRAEKLKPEEVGVVAWTQTGNFKEDVYIPLRIGTASTYKMALLPGGELKEVFISLSRLTPDGKIAQQIKTEESLGKKYYPAARSIVVPLPAITSAGYYQLDAAGILKDGSVTKRVIFYHPGK